ncbi:regulatory protein, luxR family [Pedobacter steynii]|uniref:Regulatory protein, luxR family n=1 Tax=Pedobacter steynii TaxID=430522 RepID=A0A1G9UGC9_9SPHI|nr:helix-turn-helix transcriptional regulator [Pedobacter steynii]NQX40760.1 helix-turn-helix transcriptional regulator [Pedobacter steynii]SDM59010.1 regulatory protein, luxR family [Pedobacter steynii]
MENLKPLTTEQFEKNAKSDKELGIIDYEAFFETQIKEAHNFAIGPYYWFIGDNANMLITVASNNIGELSPFSKSEWENKPALFFVENIHPEDSFYVLSAIQYAMDKIIQLPPDKQSNIRINIYARMLDAQQVFRWVLIQMPGLYVNHGNLTTCGLMMVTDLTHFNFNGRPILMTLVNVIDGKTEYYHLALGDGLTIKNVELPNITKRERQLLNLMIRGLNSPKIANELCISYSTVENHKRNLRRKTNTKTSVELTHFVMNNNLL